MNDLQEAYAKCEEITRQEARNFSYGIRLLPAPKRQAMSALYAYARRVDDIGDGLESTVDKRAALSQVRAQVSATAAGDPPVGDPVFAALGDAMARYPIATDALLEVVTGCEMDCERQRWERYDELLRYCSCVAGSIGRLSLAIFGTNEPVRGSQLADTLGLAMQLTNILRDVIEDRELMGRIYLPAEDLDRFGCDLDARGPREALIELVLFEARRAGAAYDEGLELLDLLDRRSRACVAAMAGIYCRLLGRIEANPAAVFDHRVALPSWEKAWVAARSLAGAGA